MSVTDSIRRNLTELVVVFVGVALAFGVENLREDLNERAVGEQYLQGFRQDLMADLAMLNLQQKARRTQLENALVVHSYFEGQPVNPQGFFGAYYPILLAQYTTPNRNTIDEALSSGSLRLIRDPEIRTRLLDLYATYERIARTEDHMSRDFDMYLYDPTFSSVKFELEGPWEDSPENRQAVERLLSDLRVENGVRLLIANLDFAGAGLLHELESVRLQVEQLLELIAEN